MTPSKKLFIATALLAIGYGLAILLGPPKTNNHTGLSRLAGLSSKSNRNAAGDTTPTMGALNPVGSVRLLPETKTAPADAPSTAAPSDTSEPASIGERPPDAEQSRSVAGAQASPPMSLLESRLGLRATLKDEAPRSLPNADLPARKEERPHVDILASANQPTQPTSAKELHHVWPVGYSTAGPMSDAASFQPMAADSQSATQPPKFSPPPWPIATTDDEPPRSHVVVDGDSLAKLAGRYLDDPRRREEIFALNQGVLANPELLPIGAELKLPPRGRPNGANGFLTDNSPIGSPQFHSAAHQDPTSARPVPMSLEVTPRAQILPPRPVE